MTKMNRTLFTIALAATLTGCATTLRSEPANICEIAYLDVRAQGAAIESDLAACLEKQRKEPTFRCRYDRRLDERYAEFLDNVRLVQACVSTDRLRLSPASQIAVIEHFDNIIALTERIGDAEL